MTTRQHIETLLGLINTSARTALEEYEKSGVPSPSLSSTLSHPLDSCGNTAQLKKSIRTLEAACEQLCSTLAPPKHTLVNRVMSYDSVCIRVVLEAGIADYLIEYPSGAHIDDISSHARIAPVKLCSILRALTARNCFREVKENVFANNRLSQVLVSDGNPPSNLIFSVFVDECRRGQNNLFDCLNNPMWEASTDTSKAPFCYSLKAEIPDEKNTFFNWMHTTSERSARFDGCMMGWAGIVESSLYLQELPFKDMPAGTAICEVGAGAGGLDLARLNPHLKVTLQDLPATIEWVKELWQKTSTAESQHCIEFQPMDFINDSPVSAQDVYVLRHVLHNWPDATAIKIINNIRKVMTSSTRLFVQDYVLRPPRSISVDNNCSMDMAPKPLLPDWGAGAIRKYASDINMLCMLNSRERTYKDFENLGSACGLRVEKIWDVGEENVVEYRLT